MSFRSAFQDEILRIARTPVDLFLLTGLPFILLGLMAAMISGGSVRDLRTVIVDQDGGSFARAMARNVAASPSLSVVAETPSLPEAMAMVRSERAVAILLIPNGVGTDRAGAEPIQIYYQAVFLATGTLASTDIRLAIAASLAERAPPSLGIGGIADVRPVLPPVVVTLLGNPTQSLEWYLGLLIGPSVLHLLVAASCIGSVGLLLRDGSFASFSSQCRSPVATLAGRLAPHVAAGTVWGIVWLVWISWGQGYVVVGSPVVIVAGMFLLFLATGSIALLLLGITGEVGTSLSGAVILAGSALAYSGATLPLTGGAWYVRLWSSILPLTHYIQLQMDQVMGGATGPTLAAASTLLIYLLLAGGVGMALIIGAGRDV